MIHHSDHGSQYACQADQHVLAAYVIRCHMSCKGIDPDNAVVARFFGSLKRERTMHHRYSPR
jgi:putative transposase